MPSYRNKKSTIPAPASAHVGDVIRSKGSATAAWPSDPVHDAMLRMDVLWGDLLHVDTPQTTAEYALRVLMWEMEKAKRSAALADAFHSALTAQEAEFWAQPFAENMEMYRSDAYDTRQLSDEEYAACMTWLYDQGWAVEGEDRSGFQGRPSDLPPRVWVSQVQAQLVADGQSRFAALAPDADTVVAAVTHHAVPGRRAPQAKPKVTVQRFCRSVPCADPACRYVHGDTIPRLNAPCSFGEACGASDPTGQKRSQCLRMHPGETWTAELVIHRAAA